MVVTMVMVTNSNVPCLSDTSSMQQQEDEELGLGHLVQSALLVRSDLQFSA